MRTVFHCMWLVVLLVVPFVSGMAASPEVDEFEILMDKIRMDFVHNPSIESALSKYNPADGSFTDIDYSRTDRTNWEPLIHIDRISDLFLLIRMRKINIFRMRRFMIRLLQLLNIGIGVIRIAVIGGTTRLPNRKKQVYF